MADFGWGKPVQSYLPKGALKRNSLLSQYCERLGDLVMRHRATIALDAAKVDAELASKAKSEFIAKMSHELRTPLNAIIGFSEVLVGKDTASDAPVKLPEYAHYIEESARHLLSIVNNILELSKIQSGRSALNLEMVDFEEVLSSCLTLFQDAAQQASIEIRREVWPQLPLIEVDLVKLRQIIINLISNAVKFTPGGGRITITVNMQDEDTVRMIVRDTGIGMCPEDLEVALQPFGQVDEGTDRKFEGSGLGLPIVHALVSMHHGQVHLHSEPNKGTTATVTLPITSNARAASSPGRTRRAATDTNFGAKALQQGA